MDGANDGLVFTDIKGKTVTRYNAVTKTATKKFGTASAYFDGSGDYLTVPHSTDFDLSSGLFTVEAWVYLAAYPTSGNWRTIVSKFSTTGWRLLVSDTGLLHLSTDYGGTITTNEVIPLNTWTHIAASYDGSYVSVFVNGVQEGITTLVGITNSTGLLFIGSSDGNNLNWQGYIDDLRITKGVARYTASFTPPTEPFPNGGYEVAGIITDANSNFVARTLRAYRRSDGAFLGQGVSNAATGQYAIAVDCDTEVNVVMLDDTAGTLENDQILRTTPV